MEENIRQEKILQEITVIKEPYFAQYLKKDRAVIVHKHGCSIVNPITNEEVIKIDNDHYRSRTQLPVLHPDKKKMALCYSKIIKIYDTNTGNQEWSATENNAIYSATFSPLENTVFLVCNEYRNVRCSSDGGAIKDDLATINSRGIIIKHDYITNERSEIYKGSFFYPVALHPTQNIMCAGNDKNEIFLYHLDNLKEPWKTGKLENTLAEKYQWNCDGSFIMASGGNDIYIVDSNLTDFYSCFKGDFRKRILNQDSTILATLSIIKLKKEHAKFYIIKYWDIATQKCIYTAKVVKKEKESWAVSSDRDLSFSPDGTELMIVLEDKCMIVPVPFEVYKKKAIFITWILKNYQYNNPEIPHDVIQYIMTTLYQI